MLCLNLRGPLALAALAAVASPARALVLIDDFTGGYHKATIVGEGSQSNLATNLSRAHVYAGHRATTYVVDGNPFGYTTTFEVGLGEARVTTPGPNDLTTGLAISYGTGFFRPMDLDISAYTGRGTNFEIDLATDPANLWAEHWAILLHDGQGRALSNGRFGIREGGIEFARSGFIGDTGFDWSDVDELTFVQSWARTNTAPLSYWATAIRAVPEPSCLAAGGLCLLAALKAGRRRPRRGRRTSTYRP